MRGVIIVPHGLEAHHPLDFDCLAAQLLGGLLPQPILAVPTSTGYGTAKHGETALHAMLSSCANGIVVVNIDNGYGAAMSAFRMLNLIKK